MFCVIISCFLHEANVSVRVYMLGKAVLLAKGSGNLDFSSVIFSDYQKFGKSFPFPRFKCNVLRILNENFQINAVYYYFSAQRFIMFINTLLQRSPQRWKEI